MRIIGIPYAFGSANIYNELFDTINPVFKTASVDYSGHGRRMDEELLYTMDDVVKDVFSQIKNYINSGEKYCLLGYSMGGLVAYELYYKILSAGLALPSYIFIMGTPEPNYQREYKDYETFSCEDIRNELKEHNGTSEELLEIDEFVEMLAPIVKADNIVLRDYRNAPERPESVRCGVSVLRGTKEDELENCKEGWENCIGHKCIYMEIEGEHFFLFEDNGKNVKKIAKIIEETLRSKV